MAISLGKVSPRAPQVLEPSSQLNHVWAVLPAHWTCFVILAGARIHPSGHQHSEDMEVCGISQSSPPESGQSSQECPRGKDNIAPPKKIAAKDP